MDGVLNALRRGVRILFDMGIERIVLAADHGHLFADELSEDMKVRKPYLWEVEKTPCGAGMVFMGRWYWNRRVHKQVSCLYLGS